MEVLKLRVQIWETNVQFGNYVISRSYETILTETKHLWGFVVARKSHSSSNQTAECLSQNIGNTWPRVTYDLTCDTTLTYFCLVLIKRRHSLRKHEALFQESCVLWSGFVIAERLDRLGVKACRRSFGALLPHIRQAAMKQTLCAVCVWQSGVVCR